VHDGRGRIVSVSEDVTYNGSRVPAVAHYKYDALDRMVEATDANGRTTSWNPTSQGWLAGECDPDRGCRTRTFDPTGLIVKEIDASGQRTEHDYDILGRVVERRSFDVSGGKVETANWKYDAAGVADAIGRVARVSSSNGTSEERAYDPLGRVTLRRSCVATSCVSFKTEWDVVGRIARVTYPDALGALSANSELVDYGYDAGGHVNSVGTYVPGAAYAADGLLEWIQFTSGVVQTMDYGPQRRWVRHMDVTGGQGVISTRDYAYDADGRVGTETQSGLLSQQRGFTYDPSGRLLTVSGAQPDSFGYDLAGNCRPQIGWYLRVSGCAASERGDRGRTALVRL